MLGFLKILTMRYLYVFVIGVVIGGAVGSAFGKFSSGVAFGAVFGILLRRIVIKMHENKQ